MLKKVTALARQLIINENSTQGKENEYTKERPYKKEVNNWRLRRVRRFIWQLILFGCKMHDVQYHDERRAQVRV
jgi:hypothetical protein